MCGLGACTGVVVERGGRRGHALLVSDPCVNSDDHCKISSFGLRYAIFFPQK